MKDLTIDRIGSYTASRELNKSLIVSEVELVLDKDRNIYGITKRIIDLIVSSVFIVFFMPLWLLISLVIKATSRGEVFYKPELIGLDGKKFAMYKFRTMYHDCDTSPHQILTQKIINDNGSTQKLENDIRITPLGKFLRKFSIDEFPQLINVIKGEMSLVGPRPCIEYEYKLMKNWHRQRVRVLPGMTGIWQINGRNGAKFNDLILMDLEYIKKRSLKFDLLILLKTIPVVIFGRGGG
ncbi:sugar transferase [Spirochaetota bacterium]